MAAVVRQGDIDPDHRCLVCRRLDPELQTYLHLRDGVGVLLCVLVSPVPLRIGVEGCLPPAGVLPMSGGGALQVKAGDGQAVRYPLGGQPVQDENFSSRDPSAVS